MIGIAAFWGYRAICEEAARKAEDAIDRKIKEFFEDNEVKKALNQRLRKIVEENANLLYQDLSIADAQQDTANSPRGEIAEKYPDE